MAAFPVAVSRVASIIVSVTEWSRPGIQSTPTSRKVIRLGLGARVGAGCAVGSVFGWTVDPSGSVGIGVAVDGAGVPRPRRSLFWIVTLVSYQAQVPATKMPCVATMITTSAATNAIYRGRDRGRRDVDRKAWPTATILHAPKTMTAPATARK